MVKPISLKIRAHEATRKAHAILAKLDEKDRLRRVIRHRASRALIEIAEMRRSGEKLNAGEIWMQSIETVERILQKLGTGTR
jgi:hypothetical protein